VVVVLACGALLLLGLAAGAVWSGRPFSAPDTSAELTPTEVARRFVWYAAIALTAGILPGIMVVGAGGRLAMRLLAVTAGDDAQGRITEADEVVGEITVGGTMGFVLFFGIFGGLLGGALFLLLRRFLPAGRLGGVLFGLGLLVVFGATMDPLRRQNPDFDIVGPGWVAVLVFTTLAIGFGLAIEGFVVRMSTWLPQLSTKLRDLVRYLPSAALAAFAFSVTAFLLLVGFVVVGVTRWRPIIDAVRSPRWIVGGRVLVIGVVVVSLPNLLSSVVDIAGR
jgi:hypothetical protein